MGGAEAATDAGGACCAAAAVIMPTTPAAIPISVRRSSMPPPFGVRRKSYPNIASALTLHRAALQPVLARVLVHRQQPQVFSCMWIGGAILGIGLRGAARLFVVRFARVLL